ncbi:MAG: GFA family protein [Alteraurantiacibacter sp.]
MIRTGACHCGAVQFTAEFPDERLVGSRCNCTICAMKGAVMVYLPLAAVTVTQGADVLACYQFNTMAAKHHFCSACGIHVFHQARSDPDKYAISAATLEGVRVYEDFPVMPVGDGQHHSKDHGGQRRMAGVLRFEPSPDGEWGDLNNLAR